MDRTLNVLFGAISIALAVGNLVVLFGFEFGNSTTQIVAMASTVALGIWAATLFVDDDTGTAFAFLAIAILNAFVIEGHLVWIVLKGATFFNLIAFGLFGSMNISAAVSRNHVASTYAPRK